MVEDIVRGFGFLTLGTRLKRIGDRLQTDAQRIMDAYDVPIQSSQYPILAAIDGQGPLSIGDLALAVGISQPGVTRTVGQLVRQGLLAVGPAGNDQRRRVVTLTPEGRRLIEFSRKHVWPRIEAAVKDVCADLSGPLLGQLGDIERRLTATPLDRRAQNGKEVAP
ncbi:MarR family winged helix-turn-helix transcriptional regulator [Arvimicrobium flavum]|uniref:MarR family winged helix-turn-helix transcriptional regulator n=1 Tax=Arvimicrobium flavum TaxID=3393320 RepID=UPI00237A807B|nr:MarR family transcriptional regulator [Mesorhizobium shangrilense]